MNAPTNEQLVEVLQQAKQHLEEETERWICFAISKALNNEDLIDAVNHLLKKVDEGLEGELFFTTWMRKHQPCMYKYKTWHLIWTMCRLAWIDKMIYDIQMEGNK